ncbi:MAG: TlpA disulfide reductase family protein [Acidobacteria bacterium]|nr:TlpA disulfide reductase family protein [Acidobacteriota bacterium]
MSLKTLAETLVPALVLSAASLAAASPLVAEEAASVEHLLEPDTIHPATAEQFRAVLEHHRGKVVVVNYWATWCIPCLQELPELDLLQERYGDRGLLVLAVSMDDPEKLEDRVRPFFAKRAPGLVSYLATAGDNSVDFVTSFDPEWPGALPTTMFFDRSGELNNIHLGRMLYSEFEEAVLELLEAGGGS